MNVQILTEIQEHILCFIKGGPIDHFTHVSVSVAQYSTVNYYNVACTAETSLANFRILKNELLNKNPDVVPDQASLIILDRKSSICMDYNGKDTKHTRHTARRIHLVGNAE